MDIVQINLKVVSDNSGNHAEIPALLTDHGLITPLVNCFLRLRHKKSVSWMLGVSHATKIFIEYISVNESEFSGPHDLFISFGQKLYEGTIGDDGNDPSGLYWLPKRTDTANRIISFLTSFFDNVSEIPLGNAVNPYVGADNHSSKINFAAWYRKNQYDFLGHIKNESHVGDMNKKRLFSKRVKYSSSDDYNKFDDTLFSEFFTNGIGKRTDPRAAIRDQLILLLMHGTGCRESEALHLWVQDVKTSLKHDDSVTVRIYDPEDGLAPDGWKGPRGESTRSAYLNFKYGLKPRNRVIGSEKVGWKVVRVDSKDNYIQLHWFPSYYGVMFRKLWTLYLNIISSIDRHHPYAFISFHHDFIGKPYTLNSFNFNYKASLKRIGLYGNKSLGLSSHGHRHAYARRLTEASIKPAVIMKVLHHASQYSQAKYSDPSVSYTSDLLNKVDLELSNYKNSDKPPNHNDAWNKILNDDLEDFDMKLWLRD